MPTRRERLIESLRKDDRKTDLKRIKKAAGFLGLVDETLQRRFYESEFETYADSIRSQIIEYSEQLRKIIEIG